MDAFDFIEKHPQLVGLIVTTIGGLVWHRGKKASLNDLWETMQQLGRQMLPSLLNDQRLYNDAYVLAKIRDGIWAGLQRLGVERTTLIEEYVNEVAEHIKGEFAQKLFDTHIGDFIKKQQQTVDILKGANEATP